MIHFALPYNALLFALSFLALYRYVKNKETVSNHIPFPLVSSDLKSSHSADNFLSHFSFFIRFVAFNLMILALMRPQYFSKNALVNTKGINIMIAIDVSDSMKAKDIEPNRLLAAKKVIRDFIKERGNDRVGLIVYSGDSYIQSPFSIDHSIVLNALEQIDFDSDIEKGTAIGNALALAVSRLKDKANETKVVILVSDGGNNAGEINPDVAADAASAFGVKVYTIGIGKPGYSIVPITYDDPVRGKVTENLPVEMNEDILKLIAQKTGGSYFNAQNEKTLREIYEKINAYEKTEIQQYSTLKANELFPYLTLSILLLLVFESIASNTFLRILP